MKFTASSLLPLLPVFTLGAPSPAAEDDGALNAARAVDITERENALAERADQVCWVKVSTKQPCRTNAGSGTIVGYLNPYPATFGVDCDKTSGGSRYYHVPWYGCYVAASVVNSDCSCK